MRNFKRILAVLTMLTLLGTVVVGSAFASTAPTMTLSSATVKAGDTAALTINVANNPGFTATIVKVGYDSTYLSLAARATNGDLFTSCTPGGNVSANPYQIVFNDGFEDITADGVLANLSFKVADNAPAGEYPITLIYSAEDTYNANFDFVEFEVVSGKITVEADAPADPYELSTDYVAAAKNIPVTSQYGSYNVNTALIFGSSINTGSAEKFGTEITLKDYKGKPLDIEASEAAKYVAGAGKTGFTAAVTSIREANLDKTFVAKAYAIDANGEKVYGEAAEAIFNNVIAAN